MSAPIRPICAVCSRNARTVETPRVKVRVERCVVYRDGPLLVFLSRCHGDVSEMTYPDPSPVGRMVLESDVENLEAFGGR